MEKIFIQVKNREKADILMQFLKSLDFVENVTNVDLPYTESASKDDKTTSSSFFALAGLWTGREITSDYLRIKAWPEN